MLSLVSATSIANLHEFSKINGRNVSFLFSASSFFFHFFVHFPIHFDGLFFCTGLWIYSVLPFCFDSVSQNQFFVVLFGFPNSFILIEYSYVPWLCVLFDVICRFFFSSAPFCSFNEWSVFRWMQSFKFSCLGMRMHENWESKKYTMQTSIISTIYSIFFFFSCHFVTFKTAKMFIGTLVLLLIERTNKENFQFFIARRIHTATKFILTRRVQTFAHAFDWKWTIVIYEQNSEWENTKLHI